MQNYQLLSPEEAAEEIYPYRRVWRALFSEMAILGVAVVGIVVGSFFGVVADEFSRLPLLLLTFLPVVAFLLISVRGERRVLRPRRHLVRVMIFSAVVANGVISTLVNQIITPAAWLPGAGFFERLLGYAFTLGIAAEFCKYAVVRYTVFPEEFRMRLDGIAFSVAAALGYATVFNLRYVLITEPTLVAGAIRLLGSTYLHIALAAIMGYFLGEIAISKTSYYWLPMGLFITAMISGAFAAFRVITIVSGLSAESTANRPVGAFFLSIGFTIAILGALAFLIESADERMADREGARRVR